MVSLDLETSYAKFLQGPFFDHFFFCHIDTFNSLLNIILIDTLQSVECELLSYADATCLVLQH